MRTALYLACYLLALAPGLPLGWRLFGRTPLGWVAGAMAGYALTALAFWVPAFAGVPGTPGFLSAWTVLAALVWRVRRDVPPLVTLPVWTPRDTRRWLGLLVIVLVFVLVPFSRVGSIDDTGAKRYRAYFTADFVWHLSMTQELARFEFPPVNPYLAPEPIHYYWTYFMVPAVLAGPERAPLVPVERALIVTAVGTAVLMFSSIFFAAWAVTGRSGAACAASVLALMAPSWEGLYALAGFWSSGMPWSDMAAALREMNIDAVTNWRFQGLRIDGLVRSMWWTPQHATSFTLGLLALLAAGVRPTAEWQRSWITGVFLALSVAMNPFLGAAFCLAHGLVVLGLVVRRIVPGVALVRQVAAVLPVALALGWTVLNHMGGDAGGAVTIGWGGLGANAPILTLVLSLGGLLVPAALALLPNRKVPLGDAWIAVVAFLVALTLAWFVSLTDRAWVGFRAGNIFQVTLPMLAAVGIARLGAYWRALGAGVTALLLVAGAPTTLVDTFNAQDVENTAMGPGFRWTIPLSKEQQAGFRWLRLATPPDAIVQADPVTRGRDQWSVVPSFGGRRMAAGDPISLIAVPEYAERGRRVHALMTSADLPAAHAEAQRLGITHLWLDEDDAAEIANRFRSRPDLFGLLYRRGPVHVFDVRPSSAVALREP